MLSWVDDFVFKSYLVSDVLAILQHFYLPIPYRHIYLLLHVHFMQACRRMPVTGVPNLYDKLPNLDETSLICLLCIFAEKTYVLSRFSEEEVEKGVNTPHTDTLIGLDRDARHLRRLSGYRLHRLHPGRRK